MDPIEKISEQKLPEKQTEKPVESATEQPKKDYLQKPIRTYESDVAMAIGKGRPTMATMVIAERNRQQNKKEQEKINASLINKPEEKPKINIPVIKTIGNISTERTVQNPFIPTPIPVPIPPPPPSTTQAPISVVMPITVPEEKLTPDEEMENITPKNTSKKFFLLFFSLIFIVAGILAGYLLYSKSPIATVELTPQMIQNPSIISPDTQKTILIGLESERKLAEVINNNTLQAQVGNGKIIELVLAQNNGSTTVKLTGSQFIDRIKFAMPDMLKRSLTDRWMFGVHEVDGEKLPFLILTTDFFQNAFAGMLKWESKMAEDLAVLLGYEEKVRYEEALGTTTTSTFFGIRGIFKDRVIRNRDVREFVSTQGETLFLYSFIDKDTIIITVSEDTLGYLVDRLERQGYLR